MRVLLLAILLIGFALRLYRLGGESLWYDETVSVTLAGKTLFGLLDHTAGDIHPPGYYILLYFWHKLTEPTVVHGLEFLAVWPSLFFGIIILVLLYPLGCHLFNRHIALLAVWFAAINPFHIWYSQEVRMYTMGAMLGVLCLWLLLQFARQNEPNSVRVPRPLFVYILVATAGLYTLYYFLFLLIALNIIAFSLFWSHRHLSTVWIQTKKWLSAQVAVVLLWSPWLPTFWKQATDPPVPPWRVPWTSLHEFIATLNESLSALLIGQTPPSQPLWFWGSFTIVLILTFYGYTNKYHTNKLHSYHNPLRTARYAILLYTFLPIAFIYFVTLTITPLYHVRYLFTYAPPFMLIAGAGIFATRVIARWLVSVGTIFLTLISVLSLWQFWTNPAYRADDHRAAVAQLATDWRPGDAILVNAGWAYTAFTTYWPTELEGPHAAVAPSIETIVRLGTTSQESQTSDIRSPTIIRTGSVNGSERLGWGSPTSDFFAIRKGDVVAALAGLSDNYNRIWHYRIYDTVSDPDATIRTWLENNIELRLDVGYPGRDFLRVQLYETPLYETQWARSVQEMVESGAVDFGKVLHLDGYSAPSTHTAGQILYTELHWTPLSKLHENPINLTMSLRLYNKDELIAQNDTPPFQPTSLWVSNKPYRQPLALPIPVRTPSGNYSLELVVYRQEDGSPLSLPETERAIFGQRWHLATVHVESAP